jgi:cold shock CspA family protein
MMRQQMLHAHTIQADGITTLQEINRVTFVD